MTPKPAPWIFATSPYMKTWTWKTDHFEATVLSMSTGGGVTWKVIDKSGSTEEILESGEAKTFPAAEEKILETVGKSYPMKYGYTAYAGDLATTFIIKNGKKINFNTFIGSQVTLEAYNKTNPTQPKVIIGTLNVKNYNIEIKTDRDTTYSIPPKFIMSLRKEFGNEAEEIKPRASRRIFNEEWRRGCTGKPGFREGTVVHNPNDEFCPLHDE